MIFDWRDKQLPAGPPPTMKRDGSLSYPGRIENGKIALRKPAQVTGFTIHQTATLLTPSASQIKAADGDAQRARHLRALKVHAHVTAFTTGCAVIAYPLLAYVHHANKLNASTVGVEFEAKIKGVKEAPADLVIAAGCDALAWCCEHGHEDGIEFAYLFTHRQSSSTRRGDPGEGIYRPVADFAIRKLGLKIRHAATFGDGRPIPKDWDALGVGSY